MLEPFLKWAGGKRWLVNQHADIFPLTFSRYIEPFLGSGAVFFSLRPERAILADVNKDLIDAYCAIKDNWEKVFSHLKVHHKNHGKEYYYKVRRSNPKSIYSRAAKLIYLNRTCWNGLYRVNLKGEFNVPLGTKKDVIYDTDNFEAIARLLQNAILIHGDFEQIIDEATVGDFVFVDPPYTVKHSENGFIKYNEKLFCWDDQERLSECLIRAKQRNVTIVLTNADHSSVRKLYRKHFELMSVERTCVLAAEAARRVLCNELIVVHKS